MNRILPVVLPLVLACVACGSRQLCPAGSTMVSGQCRIAGDVGDWEFTLPVAEVLPEDLPSDRAPGDGAADGIQDAADAGELPPETSGNDEATEGSEDAADLPGGETDGAGSD